MILPAYFIGPVLGAVLAAFAYDLVARPAEAQDRLKFCLRVWPRSPDVHLLAARAARLTGNMPDAEAHLNRCIELQDGATEGVQLEFLLGAHGAHKF